MEEVKKSGNKFTPSYKKSNKDIDSEKESNKEKKIKREMKVIDKKKLAIISAIVAIIVVAISTIIIILSQAKYKKYYEFEESMIKYGFDKMYNNGSSKTNEKVTKSEAIKMALSAVYNTLDIEGLANSAEGDYENAIWVEFAIRIGVITETDINENNANDFATYSDVIRYFTNAKSKILKLNLDTEDKGIVKDINRYNVDEKFGILDMVNNNIITVNTSKLNVRKNVFKGQVNEIVKNFVEEYNTITIQGEKLNINEDKIPDNAEYYPYTVISVDKKAYEIEFSGKDLEGFKSPVKLFPEQKEFYQQIKNNTEGYYNYLLNVDYITISEERFKKDLRKYLLFDLDDDIVSKYVKYVKDNRIKLTGSAKVQIPAIYYDGTYYRVRTKIEFRVESSLTEKDLLYRDLVNGKTKIYQDKEYSFYIDTYMSNAFGNKTLYNAENSFYDMLIEPLNTNIKLAGE